MTFPADLPVRAQVKVLTNIHPSLKTLQHRATTGTSASAHTVGRSDVFDADPAERVRYLASKISAGTGANQARMAATGPHGSKL
jgi:hypothetical protein